MSQTGSKSYETQSLQLLLGGKGLFLYRTAENRKSSITYLSSITHLAEYSTPLPALLAWGDMYYSAKVSKRHNSFVRGILHHGVNKSYRCWCSIKNGFYFITRLWERHRQLSEVIIKAKGEPSLNLLTPHWRTLVLSRNSFPAFYAFYAVRDFTLWCGLLFF